MKRFLKILPVFLLIFAMLLTSCNQPAGDSSSKDIASDVVSDEPTSSADESAEPTSSEETSSGEAEPVIDLSKVARLQNTYKLLTEEKKLTIGYLGGSITLGTSANKTIRDGKVVGSNGTFEDNYVCRVSKWFEETFPDAEIETVNAGIADTTTGFGLYRLESHLMNTDGHDMPDLVFIEFTSNDGVSKEQNIAQAESLIREILEINPYCEIVIISTTVNYTSNTSRVAYMDVAQHNKFIFIDVGKALAEAKTARGAGKEADGTYYYTVDNLHPSAEGYKLYAEQIIYMLEYHVAEGTGETINRKEVLPETLATVPLIDEPLMITAEEMTLTGDAEVVNNPLTSGMFLTATDKTAKYPVCDSYVKAGKGSTISVNFSGNAIGMLIGLTASDVNLRYKIDDGAWQTFLVDDQNRVGQKYDHNKLFFFKMDIPDGEHTLTMEVMCEQAVRIGAFCVDGE